MTPKLATLILQTLDAKVIKVFEDYLDERVVLLRSVTEQSPDLTKILYAQGGIGELKRLVNLRQDAVNVLNAEKEK